MNGSSELMTEVAASVVSMLYNYQLMMIAGADGVAYGVIMYVNFIFTAVFFGFAMGTGPVVGYHYGARTNRSSRAVQEEHAAGGRHRCGHVRRLPASRCAARGRVRGLRRRTCRHDAARVPHLCGGVPRVRVQHLRLGVLHGAQQQQGVGAHRACTLVFETSTVMLLPIVWGIDGVWSAIIVAEACALVLTTFLVGLHRPYGYA